MHTALFQYFARYVGYVTLPYCPLDNSSITDMILENFFSVMEIEKVDQNKYILHYTLKLIL